jgi:xylulokinase
VTALGFCGQLDGCVPVTAAGEALGNCLIWIDRRASKEIADISADCVHSICGIIADASHQAAKIRWIKRHAAFASLVARFHQPVSYMVERLTGAAVIDHALASTSMVYGLQSRNYDQELLARFGIDERELPAVAEAHECAGQLTQQGAELTGLRAGLPVAVGTGDDFATPLGAGLHSPGFISVAVGTGEVVGCLFSSAVVDPGRLVETHAYPAGHYFVENPGWLSGGAVTWLTKLLQIEDYTAFDAIAASVPTGADGLIFIPALTGAMSPEWLPGATGCFHGMTPSHGAGHFARAVLEGCGFAMRDIVDRLKRMGATPSAIVFSAGGSRSRLWAQIRADIANLPVSVAPYPNTSVLGAAMLAGVAGGSFTNLTEPMARLPPARECFLPNAKARAQLELAYARYRDLFVALKPMFVSSAHT